MPVDRSPTRDAGGSEHTSENSGQINNQETSGRLHVDKVALRAPPFWSDEPELWFAQLESQFTLIGITQDSTKYAHVLSQLDTKHAKEVKDVITNPPATDKYVTIKKALIQRVSASQEQRTYQLLEHEELGDRKPSQFLRHLRTLAGVAVPDQLLRTLWLARLPSQMRVILATRSQDRLEDVAEQADRIQEVSGRFVSEVTASTSDKTIVEQLSRLALRIDEIDKRGRPSQKHKRSRSRSRENKKQQDTCYYHRRFGNQARKCTKPCNFLAPKEEGSH